MISTSGVGLLGRNKNAETMLSETKLVMIAHLFASMTCADDKIRDIENFTAEVFLEDYNKEDIERIKDVYRASLKNYGEAERAEIIQSFVVGFTDKQKISLLRSLCAVAACDGEVHPEEQYIIKSFMAAMEIDQFVDSSGSI